MGTNKSIALKFTLVVSACTILIFSVAIGYFYKQSRMVLEQEVASNAKNLAQSLINKVETHLQSVSKVAETTATALETGTYDQHSLSLFLQDTLRTNRGIYGLGVAFEPNPSLRLPHPNVIYFSRFGKSNQKNLQQKENFPYLDQDWYQISKELTEKIWNEPYLDQNNGKVLMASCSVPIFQGQKPQRQVQGIVVANVSLRRLTRLIATTKVLESGYSFLLSHNGTYLTHPDLDLIMNESIYSQAELLGQPELRALGRKMVQGGSDFIEYTDYLNRTVLMYYAHIPSTGWSLAVVFPKEELYAGVHFLTLTVIAIALTGIALLTLAVYIIAHRVTAPLVDLAKASAEIAAGNFNTVPLPAVQSHDEVGRLTLAFGIMIRDLKAYINNLTETTAAKERIQSELKVATHIQNSLLPRIFPPFPDRPELDIFASMDPAKEVGGDFYDFFLIGEHHLCFLIADVADKGVPAALYMMVAKTLLKAEGQHLGAPEHILTSVNTILATDNDSCMFITVFCAILDTRTGEVYCANAGHNQPALIRSGQAHYLSVRPGVVLGVMADALYTAEQLQLEPGDILFLYTDGVTEASNAEDLLYGEERLLLTLEKNAHLGLAEINHAIRNDILHHANGAAQSDDVTMMAIRYWGADSRCV